MREKFFFDKEDYELLTFVNKVLIMQKDERVSDEMLNVNLHPHGIKSLALSRDMRIANAMIRLLASADGKDSVYRLQALRTLNDEVLHSAKAEFRNNTGRVLVEIMKALVRAHGDIKKQLYLASDFRNAAQGKPHTIRAFLEEYHLVEMPEDWSQLTFDHHVHDANTKGRKSPTHLIMDAHLKGIRYLTVIYYNYINEEAAEEILHAARIVNMHVRIGIEFSLPFADKHIQMVWSPRYVDNPDRFMEFLAEAPMQHLMKMGKEASAWRVRWVYDMLDAWNDTHAQEIAQQTGMDSAAFAHLSHESFHAFVASGQASYTHLAEFIYARMETSIQARRKELIKEAKRLGDTSDDTLQDLQRQKKLLDEISIEYIYDTYVSKTLSKEKVKFLGVCKAPNRPSLLCLTPLSLLDWLTSIQASGFITLQLGGLTAEDVLVLLWQCQGLITHLEIFNVQEWENGRLDCSEEINTLQQALNLGSAPRLKNIVMLMLKEREKKDASMLTSCEHHTRRKEILHEILRNIPSLTNLYSSPKLRSRMGTSTTDRPINHRKMGFVFPQTLPARSRKVLEQEGEKNEVPFTLSIHQLVRYTPNVFLWQPSRLTRIISALPWFKKHYYTKEDEWRTHSATAKYGQQSNMHLLTLNPKKPKEPLPQEGLPPRRYLNTKLSNVLKVLLGFIPASIAFHYTQTWWVLAWFGPIIWFGITGIRNILQFVVAGRGLYRTSLLRWRDYVSWSRLCDSLLYTGFSVPLLELGVRIFLLQEMLGINAITHTVLVYTVMSVVNGLYISWHNLIRGLPKEAIIGNLFRAAFAIPIALVFNEIILEFLEHVARVPQAEVAVATGSAIISKLASDTVAALIEGYADMKGMVRMRRWDYQTKLKELFHTYVRLDLTFPEEDIHDLVASPHDLLQRVAEKDPQLHDTLVINALDFMYFWYYRPRSREVCKKYIRLMTPEERHVFASLQLVLLQEREVSQLFVNGLVGRNFSDALAFYLNNHRKYIKKLLKICAMEYNENENKVA